MVVAVTVVGERILMEGLWVVMVVVVDGSGCSSGGECSSGLGSGYVW